MNRLFLLYACIVSAGAIRAQSYNWPAKPFDQQHGVNGTFCENRISGSVLRDHFHDGVDFGLSEGGNVYSILSTNVTSLSRSGGNAYIRIGRYAYVHVDPNPNLDVGDPVSAYSDVVGVTNYQNHVHFKDGYPGAEINALRSGGGLTPLTDTYDPTVAYIKFYINNTTTAFTNGKVNGLVEIVSRAYDRTNDASSVGTNNGIYRMSWQVFDSTGTQAITEKKTPYKFDEIPSSDSYITNVYFYGSDQSTYIYTPTNPITRDGYWDTRNLDPGLYKVWVEVEDTRGNTAQRWASVQVTLPDDLPPPQPQLQSITADAQGTLTLCWHVPDTTDIAGYNLEFSYDGENWTENDALSVSIAPGDSVFTVDNFSLDKSIFFRLRCYDAAALVNVSPWSDAYGVRATNSPPPLAIVDGFDSRDGYWFDKGHDFALRYAMALDKAGRAYDTFADETLHPDGTSLNHYPVTIWFTGDDGQSSDSALTQREKQGIDAYMRASGGHLIISGSGHYQQAQNGGSEALDWYRAHFYNQGGALVTADSVYGEPGTDLEGFKAALRLPDGGTGNYNGAEAGDFATVVLRFNDAARTPAAVFKQRGQSGDPFGSGALTFAAFPLELIEDAHAREQLIRTMIKLDPVTTIDKNVPRPARTALFPNYPNPFNPSTVIPYVLPTRQRVKLAVYDVRGRLLRVLVNGVQAAGSHRVTFDAGHLAGGIYFYRLQTENIVRTRKMLLLR
ncbi:MAG: T9SS C-terminal target domain-containing protein [Calditrichaeota bacterium]|nr:MAG: T9SS C-terminal target domain-containing protein [Calditrichota bacterium]